MPRLGRKAISNRLGISNRSEELWSVWNFRKYKEIYHSNRELKKRIRTSPCEMGEKEDGMLLTRRRTGVEIYINGKSEGVYRKRATNSRADSKRI